MQETVETDIIKIKEFRVALDATLQEIKQYQKSDESTIAVRKIQEGIMWLGMELKRLGNTNPYPESYNPNNTIVEPTADNLKL